MISSLPLLLAAALHAAAPLDCKKPQTIRDMKDVIIGQLAFEANADEWARCACGKAADKAGRNAKAPPLPTSAPAMPGYNRNNPANSMSHISAWFKHYLPITKDQADKITMCLWGEQAKADMAKQSPAP